MLDSTPKTKAAGFYFSKLLIITNQTAGSHNPEHNNQSCHRCETLKWHIGKNLISAENDTLLIDHKAS